MNVINIKIIGGNHQDKYFEHWIQCDSCFKWRKVDSLKCFNKLKKKFTCFELNNYTCETPEIKWRRKYKVIKKNK